jgi:hypothetical protein
MKNLNEYQIDIKNDEDLDKWRSTWTPGEPVPEEVRRYMMMVVLPRITESNKAILSNIGIKINENL